jgi:hypothetical protein
MSLAPAEEAAPSWVVAQCQTVSQHNYPAPSLQQPSQHVLQSLRFVSYHEDAQLAELVPRPGHHPGHPLQQFGKQL